MFHIGQLVVCVDDEYSYKFTPPTKVVKPSLAWPVRGRVYTIEDIFEFGPERILVLILEGLRNGPSRINGVIIPETGFAAVRFRPVRDTSIDVFIALLAPQPKLERVDA